VDTDEKEQSCFDREVEHMTLLVGLVSSLAKTRAALIAVDHDFLCYLLMTFGSSLLEEEEENLRQQLLPIRLFHVCSDLAWPKETKMSACALCLALHYWNRSCGDFPKRRTLRRFGECSFVPG
jgi:hypothetical protein